MIGWFLAAFFYLMGFVAISAMGHDLSTLPRSRGVWVRLVFWPVTAFCGWVGDAYDAIKGDA